VELYLRSRPWTFAMPGGLAADGAIGVALARRGWSAGQSVRLLLVNRLWGLCVWCALLALHLGRRALDGPFRVPPALLWAGAGAAAVAATLMWFDTTRGAAPWPAQLSRHLVLGTLGAIGAGVIVLSTQASARALGLPSSLLGASGFQASMMLGMLLPVSLNGLGLQEFLVFHGGFFPNASLAALSLLTIVLHLQRTLPALAGLVLIWRGQRGTEAPIG
jgi:hypothetical protein